MKKAALHNLGCKVNAYETEAMQRILEDAGYEIVPFSEPADVYVVNTCSVTNIADRKSRQMLHRARKQNPAAVVVAAGCYAQTKTGEAQKDGAADIIIGNNKKHELAERIAEFLEKRQPVQAVLSINEEKQPFEELSIGKPAEHTRAFLKVQDGCDRFCSYCIIPYARGRVRSRSIGQVLAEARHIAEQGYRELVLTGIHLSSYGTDCGENLLHLIREVHKIDGIWRIRLGSLEPQIVTEEFAEELSKLPKLCPHFHLSLQSGCDATLKRMNRGYTAGEYAKSCGFLRRYFSHPAVTTDVIVGFPGETEEEFAQTKAFLEQIRFYEMHIFKYSMRQGTRAAVMPDQVPEPVKAQRSGELIALGKRMSAEFREYYSGKKQEVLLEELAKINGNDYYIGYTGEYVRMAKKAEGKEAKDQTNRLCRGTVGPALTDEIYELKEM